MSFAVRHGACASTRAAAAAASARRAVAVARPPAVAAASDAGRAAASATAAVATRSAAAVATVAAPAGGMAVRIASASAAPSVGSWSSLLQRQPQSQQQQRGLFIQVEDTPNPESLKFLPGRDVMGFVESSSSGDGGERKQAVMKTLDVPNRGAAFQSPLARLLFTVEGVTGVFFGGNFVTVTKDEDVDWSMLKPQVFSHLTDFFNGDEPVVDVDAVAPSDTAIHPDDSEVVVMIKELIETRVRPGVQVDGGDIIYRGFEDGVVLLQMQGSCSGCPSSSVTLKQGIERLMMHYIPEVLAVVAVDDDELSKINSDAFAKTDAKARQAEQEAAAAAAAAAEDK